MSAIKTYNVLTLSLALFLPVIGHAIDCRQATTGWQKEVCANKDLISLDQEVNATYKKCLQSTSSQWLILDNTKYPKTLTAMDVRVKAEQQAWLENINNIVDAVGIKKIYFDRLNQLKLCTGQLKLDYSVKQDTNYVWKVIKLSNKTIIEYPQLINQPEKIINPINKEIEAQAKELLLSSLAKTGDGSANGRFGISYGNYWYSIESASSNRFSIEVHDNSEGCLGGCANSNTAFTDVLGKHSWNLVTGKEVNHFENNVKKRMS